MTRRHFLRLATVPAAVGVCVAARGQGGHALRLATVTPPEDTESVLRNPDMGWTLYENYPLDRRPGGASFLVTSPGDALPMVDNVAIMFSWYDIEREPGLYDFTHADYAYDYWRQRGKWIHLRMSTESLLWWTNFDPPSGKGVPDYLLRRLPADRQEVRECEGFPYTVVDAREPYYLERLEAFLAAVAEHFTGEHEVRLIDLRGHGLWGEWHQGFHYGTVDDRRQALMGVIDRWSAAFPEHYLALSYSYDPDSPPGYYAGPTDHYYPEHTGSHQDFLRWSAFDYAMTKPNITLRRDGAGGAVHSNERKLCEEAFATLKKGPMMSEFLGLYPSLKEGGPKWMEFVIRDALSLHPNYLTFLGREFHTDFPELAVEAGCGMGYRLVPTRIRYPSLVRGEAVVGIEIDWVNRGVGRAMRDYRLQLVLADYEGRAMHTAQAGSVETSRFVAGQTYTMATQATFTDALPGDYELYMALTDPRDGEMIALALRDRGQGGTYHVGPISTGLA